MWRIAFPIVSGYATSAMCGGVSSNAAIELPQRPPAIVFKIIWPVLYILLGISWETTKGRLLIDILHAVSTCFLILWLVMYSCLSNTKSGPYIIAAALSSVMVCMILSKQVVSVLALAPLLAWLLIAFHLNWHTLDKYSK